MEREERNDPMSKTCLITGASGFLGREVMSCLAQHFRVIGMAHQRSDSGFHCVDLRNSDALLAFLDEVHPDLLVHLAAYRNPDFCEKNPEDARRLNVAPTQVVCDALPPKVPVLFVSTDYVFDGRSPPYHEDEEPCPINQYGRSKVESEEYVRCRSNGMILRVPLLIGAGETLIDSGFISEMIAAIRLGTHQEVDDVLVRRPTWTRDAARAIAFLLRHRQSGVFHLSGARGGTRYQWTQEMADLIDLPCHHLKPATRVVERLAARPPDSTLSDERIHALGFPPTTDFKEVVRTVLSEFQE